MAGWVVERIKPDIRVGGMMNDLAGIHFWRFFGFLLFAVVLVAVEYCTIYFFFSVHDPWVWSGWRWRNKASLIFCLSALAIIFPPFIYWCFKEMCREWRSMRKFVRPISSRTI